MGECVCGCGGVSGRVWGWGCCVVGAKVIGNANKPATTRYVQKDYCHIVRQPQHQLRCWC
jgi:hypothetical protein